MKVDIVKEKTPLDEIKDIVKGKSKSDFNTVASLRELVLKLIEKDGIKLN